MLLIWQKSYAHTWYGSFKVLRFESKQQNSRTMGLRARAKFKFTLSKTGTEHEGNMWRWKMKKKRIIHWPFQSMFDEIFVKNTFDKNDVDHLKWAHFCGLLMSTFLSQHLFTFSMWIVFIPYDWCAYGRVWSFWICLPLHSNVGTLQ